MSQQGIDEQLKQYYEAKTLSPETLARLKANVSSAVSHKRRTSSLRRALLIAAALVPAILAGVLYLQRSPDTPSFTSTIAVSDAATMRISHELVDRHEHCQTVDFEGENLADVVAEMADLGFEPVMPDESEMVGIHLVGAHYCMVDGQRALHAFFADSEGARISLFETPLSSDSESIGAGRIQNVGSYVVTLSRKQGLLVAFAQTAT